jgi:hypothetical protein
MPFRVLSRERGRVGEGGWSLVDMSGRMTL